MPGEAGMIMNFRSNLSADQRYTDFKFVGDSEVLTVNRYGKVQMHDYLSANELESCENQILNDRDIFDLPYRETGESFTIYEAPIED